MAITFAYLQAASSTADASTYTFSSQNFGTADSARYIIACIHARKGSGVATNISSVTIGGVTASQIAVANNTSSNSNIAAIYIAAVPTGTSGSVAVTFDSGQARAGIQLYSAIGIDATPADTGNSTAQDPQTTLDIPAGGFGIGCANVGASTSHTWTGLTENDDTVIELAFTMSSASDTFVSSQSGLTVKGDSGSTTAPAGAFASWGPATGGSGNRRRRSLILGTAA